MATPTYPTPEQLRNASQDANTLDKFGNDAAGVPNINRVGNDVENMMTLRQRMLDAASDVANRQVYLTKDEMLEDTTQPVNTPARVETGEGAGDYVMTATGWEWSDVQPITRSEVQEDVAQLQTTDADLQAQINNDRIQHAIIESDDVALTFVGSDGGRFWLEANLVNGGPTEYSVLHLLYALSMRVSGSYDPQLTLYADPQGRRSQLTIDKSTGRFARWVMDQWADEFENYYEFVRGEKQPEYRKYRTVTPGTQTTISAHDKYVYNGELLPASVNMQDISVWGSSSSNLSADQMAAALEPLAPGVVYTNEGKGGEFWRHTYARLGSIPALLRSATGQIPASGSVALTSSNMPASTFLKTFQGTLAGVDGELSCDETGIKFTRTTGGSAVTLSPDTPFLPTIGPLHRSGVLLLWAGKNDLASGSSTYNSPQGYFDATWTTFQWAAGLVKRVLVMGPHQSRDTVEGSNEYNRINVAIALCSEKFDLHFFDVNAYQSSPEVWADTGITPTATDLAHQAIGTTPPSLASGNLHHKSVFYTALAARVAERLQLLGWY